MTVGKRRRGTGHLYEKWGSYYGRWYTLDGRYLNRIVGPVRTPGMSDGLTRAQAERAFRRIQDAEERAPRTVRGADIPTVGEVADSLRQKLSLSGARRSYLEGCESMQRVHIAPRLGSLPVTDVTTAHVQVDWAAQRIRVRNTFVRGEHSTQGKSDLSTRRSVPMADRLAGELDCFSQRTEYKGEDDLVFAHPQTGSPLDRSKVTKRFKAACKDAGVRPVKFHDLRHTFATRLAASGQPLRMIQEFLGHADGKTTQIYAHYAPSEHEVQIVNEAFAAPAEPSDIKGWR